MNQLFRYFVIVILSSISNDTGIYVMKILTHSKSNKKRGHLMALIGHGESMLLTNYFMHIYT